MSYLNHTYRIEDGERIEGSWRHIFIKNGGMYFLTDLKVYADGMIYCWGLVDFATFQQKVTSGWIATTFQQGAVVSGNHLARWHFDKPVSVVTPQQLIAEVADEIEHLAGRPTSEDRFVIALNNYLDEPDTASFTALRDAYMDVPEHLRVYLLGDQDARDIPLRMLFASVNDSFEVVQPSKHEAAWAYFRHRRDMKQQLQATPSSWDDDTVTINPSVVRFDKFDGGQSYLANDYPAPITLDGSTFPTIEHAYWALGTTNPDIRDRIVCSPTAHEARTIGQGAPLRSDWNVVRLAVMLRLVREKFRQHPDLAARLVATGDGRLINGLDSSRYWGDYHQGRNWLGRILELVRAELLESTGA